MICFFILLQDQISNQRSTDKLLGAKVFGKEVHLFSSFYWIHLLNFSIKGTICHNSFIFIYDKSKTNWMHVSIYLYFPHAFQCLLHVVKFHTHIKAAIAWRRSVKKLFWKISQNSQKGQNLCQNLFLIKLQAWRHYFYY